MSINKIGTPQSMTVVNRCCIHQCDKNADVLIDGKPYCFEHAAEYKTTETAEQNPTTQDVNNK